MNLRQLRYFCEVVGAGSIVQAAERLHVAPTAISMQVAQLEAHIGGPLFDRGVRPMPLTPLGQFFHPRALEMLVQMSRLDRESRRVADADSGWIGIGFTRSTIYSIVPAAVRQFSKTHPDIRVELLEMVSERQPDALRDGNIHVGIARHVEAAVFPPGLRFDVLFDDPLVAALSSEHRLAQRDALAASELASIPFIRYPRDPDTRFAADTLALFDRAGVKPTVGYEAVEIHTALGLVAAGLGFTMVGRSVASHNRTDVRFVPVTGLPGSSRVGVLTRDEAHHASVTDFLAALRVQSGHESPH